MVLRGTAAAGRVAIVLLAVVAAALVCFRVSFRESYVEDGFIEVRWGDGEDEIQKALTGEGTVLGIRTFFCDAKRRVYLVDSAKARLFKFEGEPFGAPGGIVSFDSQMMSIDDGVVCPDGTIVVADNKSGQILAVNAEGKCRVLWKHDDRRALNHVIESLWVDDSGAIYVAEAVWEKSLFTRRLLKIVVRGGQAQPIESVVEVMNYPTGMTEVRGSIAEAVAKMVSCAVDNRGRVYVETGCDEPFSREIRVFDPRGTAIACMRITESKLIENFALVGADRSGDLYLGIDLGTPAGKVVRYARDGARVAEVPAPYSGDVHSFTYARVDGGGNLYILEPTENGARVKSFRPTRKAAVTYRWR